MGHFHITIAMLGPSLMSFCQIGELGGGFIKYPLRSPDLTPLDFFLWGYVKDKVSATKPAAVANLREAIEYECAQIPRKLLHDVSDFVAWRCQQCLDQNGGQFENRQ